MDLPLILVSSYLITLLILQILTSIELKKKKLTPIELHDITFLSVFPIINMLFLVIIIGISINKFLNRKDTQ